MGQDKKVIAKIYEAYDSFKINGAITHLEKDGKYKIRGLTKEGIKIEMVITQKGHMKTAYPSFK